MLNRTRITGGNAIPDGIINELLEFRLRKAETATKGPRITSEEIARQTAEFIARGGVIQQLSPDQYNYKAITIQQLNSVAFKREDLNHVKPR